MLRITQFNHNEELHLKLEGKLLAAWVDELLALLPRDRGDWNRTRLDLSQVSYVDAAGAALLHRLIDAGARVDAASSFVAELLHARKS